MLSRAGFDWIIRNVIFKVGKVRFGPNAAQMYCIMRCEATRVLKYERCGITLKIIFKAWKVQYLCDLFELISQKRCMLWPMFLWNTYTKSYNNLSVYFKTFDLRWHLEVKEGSHNFQQVIYHKRYIVWSKFLWKAYSKSYMACHVTLKGQIKVIELLAGCFS